MALRVPLFASRAGGRPGPRPPAPLQGTAAKLLDAVREPPATPGERELSRLQGKLESGGRAALSAEEIASALRAWMSIEDPYLRRQIYRSAEGAIRKCGGEVTAPLKHRQVASTRRFAALLLGQPPEEALGAYDERPGSPDDGLRPHQQADTLRSTLAHLPKEGPLSDTSVRFELKLGLKLFGTGETAQGGARAGAVLPATGRRPLDSFEASVSSALWNQLHVVHVNGHGEHPGRTVEEVTLRPGPLPPAVNLGGAFGTGSARVKLRYYLDQLPLVRAFAAIGGKGTYVVSAGLKPLPFPIEIAAELGITSPRLASNRVERRISRVVEGLRSSWAPAVESSEDPASSAPTHP